MSNKRKLRERKEFPAKRLLRELEECHDCERVACPQLQQHWDDDGEERWVCCQCAMVDGTGPKNLEELLCKVCIELPFLCTSCGRSDCEFCQDNQLSGEGEKGYNQCCKCFESPRRGHLDKDEHCKVCIELDSSESSEAEEDPLNEKENEPVWGF